MIRSAACAALFTSFALIFGCVKPESDTGPGSAAPGQPGIGAHVQRGKEKRSLENDIKQIALFMTSYYTENGQPPRNWPDFKAYIQRDAGHIVREIEEQQIAIVWGAPMNSSTIV